MDATDVKHQGYKCDFVNRPKKHGGGLAIVYKSTIKCERIPRHNQSPPVTFEHGSWQLQKTNQTLNVELFYRLPGKDPISKFISEFITYVDKHRLNQGNPLFAGDFNVHYHDVTNIDTLDFQATTQAMGLHQHMECATHRQGHTLDLVFTPFTLRGTVLSITQGPYLSDHCMLILTVSMQRHPNVKKHLQL